MDTPTMKDPETASEESLGSPDRDNVEARWTPEGEAGHILEEAKPALAQVGPRNGPVSIASGALRRRQGAADEVPPGCPRRLEGTIR
jgi:hypothetical protein